MIVKTQDELDAALADGRVSMIEIRSEHGVWLSVGATSGKMVVAWGNSSVVARGNSSVVARGNSSVVARGNSSVVAWGNSSVVAWGNASVEARENSSVEAWGNASVVALGNASVEARENSSVVAWENSGIHAYGRGPITATPHVAVHLRNANAHVEGGVVIDVTQVDATGENWLKHHGIEVNDGKAVLFKAVNDQWSTGYGFDYSPGATPEAPDWNDRDECGGGLHFGPTPRHARDCHAQATHFVAVEVEAATLRPISGNTAKAKAPRCRVLHEVDINGQPVRTEATP